MTDSAIVGYHLNPLFCGVARFNAELARRLGIPFVGLEGAWGEAPLLSLKWTEIATADQDQLLRRIAAIQTPYRVFWHDAGHPLITARATEVLHATRLGCPPVPLPEATRLRLVTLGMAHKFYVDPYRRLRALLDEGRLAYEVRVSYLLHEGTTWQGLATSELATIMGASTVTHLGCLSDQALAEELQAADLVCAFFPSGVQANNTSVHLAMQAGVPVVTNFGVLTPVVFRHGATIFDIHQLTAFPTRWQRHAVAAAGQHLSQTQFSWTTLLEQLCHAPSPLPGVALPTTPPVTSLPNSAIITADPSRSPVT